MKTTTNKATGTQSQTLSIGAWIYIHLGGAVCHSAVVATSIAGTVVATTEKAIRVQLQDERGAAGATVWFPKRALVAGRSGDSYSLARWFAPTGYTARMIDRYMQIGAVSVA